MKPFAYAWTTLAALLVLGCPAPADERVLVRFGAGDRLPEGMQQNNVDAAVVDFEGGRALRVDFHVADWPNVFFAPAGAPWDWSAYAGLAIELYNPTQDSVPVCIRIDNEGAPADGTCVTASTNVAPGEHKSFEALYNGEDTEVFWGMRGLPERGPIPAGKGIDPARITAFQVFVPRPSQPHTLLIKAIRLHGPGGKLTDLVPMPFVDRFGQCKHGDWPGKLHDAEEFAARRQAEEAAWAAAPRLPGRDAYGGWADGPQLDATGWFRTALVDGKWWLVTPDGRLFFSNGVDCVGTWQRTFVTGRDGWFEWLPERGDPVFGGLFSEHSGAHSMADAIGGQGTAFGFYTANLIRKYGDAWQEDWRKSAYKRLEHWGFNTIANWSQGDVLEHSPMPFVASGGVWGDVLEVEGAKGYWGRMKDVYDESFAAAVERSMQSVAKPYAGNPLCIGYFVDNELSWGAVRQGVLASPPSQPARQAFIAQLEAKYGSLAALNAAWGCGAADWGSLRASDGVTEAAARDLDALEYAFARTYFEQVKAALERHAPHQLYLGCRFSSAPEMAVKACTEVADVVSFNRYERAIKCEQYSMDKPILIGEFHFGALDRGLFHTGLVPTRSQEERAQCYIDYVRAVADCPAFVGCHWFQFIDEPVTGRWFDGENYNIGFLTVVDSPYPELVEAAQRVHAEVYARRYGGAGGRGKR